MSTLLAPIEASQPSAGPLVEPSGPGHGMRVPQEAIVSEKECLVCPTPDEHLDQRLERTLVMNARFCSNWILVGCALLLGPVMRGPIAHLGSAGQ